MSSPLLIAGASVRAAAWSATQAGRAVFAADLFRDRDLPGATTAIRVTNFDQLPDIAARFVPMPWCYTGGLENRPDLVAAISRRHQLRGCAPRVLRTIRDPESLGRILRAAGIAYPEIVRGTRPGGTGCWLRKPYASCGGQGIHRVAGPAAAAAPRTNDRGADARDRGDAPFYCQRYIPGPAFSAAFVCAAGRSVLLGASRQLLGCRWAGASGFQYVGSIGPCFFEPPVERVLRGIGECLACEGQLTGVFGVDFVRTHETTWVIEVNPRYTASMELLERAGRFSMLAYHLVACASGEVPASPRYHRGIVYGKAILFTDRPIQVGRGLARRVDRLRAARGGNSVADIPRPGRRVRRGGPVLTVFACGRTAAGVRRQLCRNMQWLRGG